MPRYIDLSHPLEDQQCSYPGDPAPRIERVATLKSDGHNLTHLSLSAHQGTHFDAPLHFLDDAPSIDKLPLDVFHGPARCVDLAPEGELPPGAMIDIEQLVSHTDAFGAGGRVLLRSGWSRRFGQDDYFPDESNERPGLPQLTLGAAHWIAETGIVLLGIDWPTPSVCTLAEVHRTLLGAEPPVVLLENLTNLKALPERFTLSAFPLKIAGSDGSPVRAVGIVG